jgi:DNA-binding protein Fis
MSQAHRRSSAYGAQTVTLYGLLSEVEDAEATWQSAADPRALEEIVLMRLRAYARELRGHAARDLYSLVMPQLERPLVRVAMELAGGQQTRAAEMLGIHRNTLRVRLRALGIAKAR